MSQVVSSQISNNTSLHDVRYFSALLRGVSFASRASATMTKQGLTVVVEEARTLTGTGLFDEYEYVSQNGAKRESISTSQPSELDEDMDAEDELEENESFEFPINTFLECLNIFGSAGGAIGGSTNAFKRWRKDGEPDDAEEIGSDKPDPAAAGTRRIETYFGGGSGSEKRTGMRMTWYGDGYPLTLLLQEDTAGPTATCEINTFEADPSLELALDLENVVMKIILKSSWLRDALSELDPSCHKLTFLGNPPNQADRRPRATAAPVLRIHAAGDFGSTEMDYPNDREVLESVECVDPVRFTYRFSHIARASRALQSSTKASLRIDHEGMLSMQLLMSSPKPGGAIADSFIEFRCLAIDED
ncbi:Rad1/Rec1/Rad17 [Flagelloscypha sp. PMI_526]|nr:Rad1/Rec1/Rad17 [Flagelloscypha sp. PMI_526]